MGGVIALDAMGGDDAPAPEVAGAIAAVRGGGRDTSAPLRVLLLGDEPRLRAELAQRQALDLLERGALSIRACSEVITMHDAPGAAVRQKRDASMRVAFELLRAGQVQAVVSAGNSGAMLACGLLVLGRVKGVERPGIIVTFPTLDSSRPNGYGECALLDMGANVECKASHLAQFAVLGATFARHSLGRERPRVGLLANGEEESKGTEVLREAYGLLSRPLPLAPDDAPPGLRSAHPGAPDFEFVGFVEGRDIFEFRRPAAPGVPGALGGLDVVVTDGFTGNVVLKTAEGAANLLGQSLRRAAGRSLLSRLGGLLLLPSLRVTRDIIDIERRGGALLLGVAGVVVICHGRTSSRAIHSALTLAARQVDSGLTAQVASAIDRHRGLWTEETA